jgi:hypothetical protein
MVPISFNNPFIDFVIIYCIKLQLGNLMTNIQKEKFPTLASLVAAVFSVLSLVVLGGNLVWKNGGCGYCQFSLFLGGVEQ